MSCASRGEGGGALYFGGRELSRVLTTPAARHSRASLRVGAGAAVMKRVRAVGGCVAGSCVCSPVEVGNGADVSRSQTFHPLSLAQTMPCESALQLVAVVTHYSATPASSIRVTPPPSSYLWLWLKLVFCRIVWRLMGGGAARVGRARSARGVWGGD